MTGNLDIGALFSAKRTLEVIGVADLVEWRSHTGEGRLLVPPIQRSLVWNNGQVLRYWDSLLRGFPAGMILVHRVAFSPEGDMAAGIDAAGDMTPALESDWQLFDGQQRITTLMLGLGKGTWASKRTIWVDLGREPDRRLHAQNEDGCLFNLRMTTPSHPFGYDRLRPDEKLSSTKQRQGWIQVRENYPESADWISSRVYGEQDGGLLSDAVCAVPFAEICKALMDDGRDSATARFSGQEGSIPHVVEEFFLALEDALSRQMIAQLVPAALVHKDGEYERFFERIGRGGTSLSDAELIYSKLKHRHPSLHDTMRAIMEGGTKRLAGEVDLAMGALRVAKSRVQGTDGGARRPKPSDLYDRHSGQVESEFMAMIGDMDRPGSLPGSLETMRDAIEYSTTHPDGLPSMLLARLPRQLLDVLILLSYRLAGGLAPDQPTKEALTALCLHWLLFVSDGDKASSIVFRTCSEQGWSVSETTIRALLVSLETDGETCRLAPRSADIDLMESRWTAGTFTLQPQRIADRFTEADPIEGRRPGDALRVLATDRGLVQKVLIWLQRDYIASISDLTDFDPTAGNDEDLPFDLDHLVPASFFDGHWTRRAMMIDDDITRDFQRSRWDIGNSLGNFRWLEVRKNRERQNNRIDESDIAHSLLGAGGAASWNGIIDVHKVKPHWTLDQVATFQRIVDQRTIMLYRSLLERIEGYLPVIVKDTSLSAP